MLKKSYRLTGKDVRYITKKRQFFSGGLFGFFYIPQYSNRHYNQYSLHVTIKLDKRASTRRIIKKAILQVIEKTNPIHRPYNGKFYKIFIILNKKKLEELQKLIASKDKKAIIIYIQRIFIQSFNHFQQKLGK